MTAHDELRILYALRRRALERAVAAGDAPARLGAVSELIEARERRFLDGSAAKTGAGADASSRRAA